MLRWGYFSLTPNGSLLCWKKNDCPWLQSHKLMSPWFRAVLAQDTRNSVHRAKYKFGSFAYNLLRILVKLLSTYPGYKNIQTKLISTEFNQLFLNSYTCLSNILDGCLKTPIVKKCGLCFYWSQASFSVCYIWTPTPFVKWPFIPIFLLAPCIKYYTYCFR